MNTYNIDPLFNKHVALGEMLVKEQGIKKAIESLIESIDDSIKDVDAKYHCDLTHIKLKLMELL
jgi:hypothetical protein